jgi:hypothetical protein
MARIRQRRYHLSALTEFEPKSCFSQCCLHLLSCGDFVRRGDFITSSQSSEP